MTISVIHFTMRSCRAKLEVERQTEMDIVEKIISEKKALRTRMNQQPHLFVDRNKELVKARYLITTALYFFILLTPNFV